MDTLSYWKHSTALPRFSKIKEDCKVDVVIIGAGITGVTAAYLLRKRGHTVALLDRDRVGGFDTAHTTAHLTCVTDLPLTQLARRIGKDRARAAWEAGLAAIDQIYSNVTAERIACEFEWVPAYYHLPFEGESSRSVKDLKRDAALANELGFAAAFLEAIPFIKKPGVVFHNQAKLHPCKYLAGLLRTIPGDGSYVFEHSNADEIDSDPLTVHSNGCRIRARYLIVATHYPLVGIKNLASATLLQTKLFHYTTYVVSAPVTGLSLPAASFWDTCDPYHYLRVDHRRGFDYVILGGEDHKTGQNDDTSVPYQRLEAALKALIPKAKPDHRWSGQVVSTPDGLPYIGENAERQFIATGFAGNGMTFGTIAGVMAVDAFLKRNNPWKELFEVTRKNFRAGAWDYLKENKDYPYYMVRDRFAKAEGKSLRSLKSGDGKILNLDGKKVAAFRDDEGKVTLLSPVCPHLKCIVAWNGAEQTWDCPCHGSRFAATGEVMAGPAECPLSAIEPEEK